MTATATRKTRNAKTAPVADAPTPEPTEPETAPVAETETAPVAADKPKKEPRLVDLPLDAETAAWVAQHARPAVAPCLCGCGETTKGRFFPGHDAILKARLARTDNDDARQALATFGW